MIITYSQFVLASKAAMKIVYFRSRTLNYNKKQNLGNEKPMWISQSLDLNGN